MGHAVAILNKNIETTIFIVMNILRELCKLCTHQTLWLHEYISSKHGHIWYLVVSHATHQWK